MHEEPPQLPGKLEPTGRDVPQPKAEAELPLVGVSTSPGGKSKNPDRRRMDAHLTGGNRGQRRDYIRRSKRIFRLAYGFGSRHNRRVPGAQTARNRSLSRVQEGVGSVPSGSTGKG